MKRSSYPDQSFSKTHSELLFVFESEEIKIACTCIFHTKLPTSRILFLVNTTERKIYFLKWILN